MLRPDDPWAELGLPIPHPVEQRSYRALELNGQVVGYEERLQGGNTVLRRRYYRFRLRGEPVEMVGGGRAVLDEQGRVVSLDVVGVAGDGRVWRDGGRVFAERGGKVETLTEAPLLLDYTDGPEQWLGQRVAVFDAGSWQVLSTEVQRRGDWIVWELAGGLVEWSVDTIRLGPWKMVRVDEPPLMADEVELLALVGVPSSSLPNARQAHLGKYLVSGEARRVEVPLWEEIPHAMPISAVDRQNLGHGLSDELTLLARDALGDVEGRREAVERLVHLVQGRLEPEVTPGLVDPLLVLGRGGGDCNEYAALFDVLARAAGMDARVVSGLVYDEPSVGPGFYPHAWVEVDFGADLGWLGVDPMLGQRLADPTHLKLSDGEVNATMYSLLGDIDLVVLELR